MVDSELRVWCTGPWYVLVDDAACAPRAGRAAASSSWCRSITLSAARRAGLERQGA
jgi:hypothetical protein